MTPKRAAVLIVVATVVVLAVMLWPRFGPGSGSQSAPVARPAQRQGTVLMIPGYGGGTTPFDLLATDLKSRGIRSEVVDVGDGTRDLNDYAARVTDRARELMQQGQPAPDLVGYSAGGLTARIAETTNPKLFRRVVSIGTPHAGTRTAEFGAQVGDCPQACQQMRPDSQFLESLPQPSEPDDWLSIWSDSDEVIRPADSSELPDVTNLPLQSVCAGDVGHGEIVADRQTIAAVDAFLAYQALPRACVT